MEKYATQLGNGVTAYHGDIALIAVDPGIYLIVILAKTLYQNDAILLFNVPAERKPPLVAPWQAFGGNAPYSGSGA